MKIKVCFEDEIRLFDQKGVKKSELLQKVREFVTKKFRIRPCHFTLVYLDEEDDMVILDSQEDLEQAIELAEELKRKSLKLTVRLSKKRGCHRGKFKKHFNKGEKDTGDSCNFQNRRRRWHGRRNFHCGSGGFSGCGYRMDPSFLNKKLNECLSKNVKLECPCGGKLESVYPGKAYKSSSVMCDGCKQHCPHNSPVFHCTEGKSPKHKDGFDLCGRCVLGQVVGLGAAKFADLAKCFFQEFDPSNFEKEKEKKKDDKMDTDVQGENKEERKSSEDDEDVDEEDDDESISDFEKVDKDSDSEKSGAKWVKKNQQVGKEAKKNEEVDKDDKDNKDEKDDKDKKEDKEKEDFKYAKELDQLQKMGFPATKFNKQLLVTYKGQIHKVLEALLNF